MTIYFIQVGDDGPIKIGFSFRADFRYDYLQTASPFPLALLGTMEGGLPEERALHQKFSKYRIRGEWFESDTVIIDFIKNNCTNQDQEGTITKDEERDKQGISRNVLRVNEAAKRLNVTPRTATRWAEDGLLRGSYRLNPLVPHSPWVIPEEAIQQIQRQREEQARRRN